MHRYWILSICLIVALTSLCVVVCCVLCSGCGVVWSVCGVECECYVVCGVVHGAVHGAENSIGAAGTTALADALRGHTSLQSLNLSSE